MDNIAILLTVYNRKNVTINGITTLFSIMKMMKDFHFEVFMTNDGSKYYSDNAKAYIN